MNADERRYPKGKALGFSSDFAEEKWPFGQRTSSSTLFGHLVEAAAWKTDKVLDKVLDKVQNREQLLLIADRRRLQKGSLALHLRSSAFIRGHFS